jgi:hypothetical protein
MIDDYSDAPWLIAIAVLVLGGAVLLLATQ